MTGVEAQIKAIKARLSELPKLTCNDSKQLFDLAYLLSELQM